MNQEDEDRLNRVHAMPCMCCVDEHKSQITPTEAHHIVDKGYRKHSGGHQSTLPLCEWHHRGVPAYKQTISETLFEYGPSLALHKRLFIETYGTERELLEKVNEQC